MTPPRTGLTTNRPASMTTMPKPKPKPKPEYDPDRVFKTQHLQRQAISPPPKSRQTPAARVSAPAPARVAGRPPSQVAGQPQEGPDHILLRRRKRRPGLGRFEPRLDRPTRILHRKRTAIPTLAAAGSETAVSAADGPAAPSTTKQLRRICRLRGEPERIRPAATRLRRRWRWRRRRPDRSFWKHQRQLTPSRFFKPISPDQTRPETRPTKPRLTFRICRTRATTATATAEHPTAS